ncbi:MAG TPA: NBR1-Ig-like domain-containing protein [Anaerolineales bacterium]|nr:NBR1-Ig-like domain-containing protein [Anaerolineales bacterium]
MDSKLKALSAMTLIALILSLMPAFALPTRSLAATCNWAQFIADVTVPDGTSFAPGATFRKTWRLKNIGTCTWTTGYALVFDSGERMGAPATVNFTTNVAPGQTVDLTVDMTAPSNAGRYIGYWKLRNAAGGLFGIGSTANKAFWVEINVTGSSGTTVAYDFTANAASATWSSGSGGLSFPGTDGDVKGFALKKDKPKFESGVEASQPGLLFVPQNITNGFIQARYPTFRVQSGDRFQATIGCEFGSTSCYVAYRLDYEVGGLIKTFWSFRERYEGLTYNVNLDLSPLAGRDVQFILYISAYGSPAGDRALWGNPVIVRRGNVPPTVTGTPPTATPTRTPAPVTPTVPPSSCDKVQFIADVTIRDGTTLNPGAAFTKTWRLKNVGSCTWTTSYQLVFFSGEQMGAPSSLAFTRTVSPGQTIDISVNMVAPTNPGSYRGYWMFKNANGALFGIGAQANKPWWVDIKVAGPTVTPGGPTLTPTATPTGPTPTPIAGAVYDFAANVCSGTWFSGAGQLPCPGAEGDAKGFVLRVNNPKLENGVTDSRPGILTFPQNIQNGYIQGFFPAFRVQSGDRFRSIINCEGGATNCYVAFRLDYQTGTEPIKTFWGPFLERHEGQYYSVDVDLTPLAGKDVKFILTVLAAGVATGDRALWVGPHIYRGTSATPPTPTSSALSPTPTTAPPSATLTATATSDPVSGWNTYQNNAYGFLFKFPPGSTTTNQTDTTARIFLPFTAGTNLVEKFVDVSVVVGANPCKLSSPGGPITSSETVTINGIQFLKESGEGAGAGNFYDFVAYSSMANNACVSLTFVLHSTNPGNYATPPPLFDKTAESAVFDLIIRTFDWIG